MLRRVCTSLLMLATAWSAADGDTCKFDSDGRQVSTGSDESEETSLLQQKRARAPRKECALPSLAMPAIKSGLNLLLDGRIHDIALDQTLLSQYYKVSRCGLNVTLGAALNITGLEQVHIDTVDCEESKCIETGLFGVCTKYSATLLVGFTSPNISVVGTGDANATFKGRCYFLKHLPDLPEFSTGVQVLDPEVMLKFEVELDIFPPHVSNTAFNLVNVSYRKLAGFDCGFSWWPSVNDICNDWLSKLVNEVGDQILKFINHELETHPDELGDMIMEAGKPADSA